MKKTLYAILTVVSVLVFIYLAFFLVNNYYAWIALPSIFEAVAEYCMSVVPVILTGFFALIGLCRRSALLILFAILLICIAVYGYYYIFLVIIR